MEIVNDSAPAEIEEMFAQYAGTGHVVLTIDRYARVDAEVRPARAVCGGLLDPRNAAAGTMRNLEPALVAKRGLAAFTYQVISTRLGAERARPDNSSHAAMLTAMREWMLNRDPLAQFVAAFWTYRNRA